MEGQGMCQNQVGPQKARGESEVIVLNEDERIVRSGFLDDRGGESRVGSAIHFEIARPKDGRNSQLMAKGPESLVGKAVIVATALGVRQPNAPETVVRGGGWRAGQTTISKILEVVAAFTACHPYSGAGFDQRLKGGDNAAGGASQRLPPVGVALDLDRSPIRQDDDLSPRAGDLERRPSALRHRKGMPVLI